MQGDLWVRSGWRKIAGMALLAAAFATPHQSKSRYPLFLLFNSVTRRSYYYPGGAYVCYRQIRFKGDIVVKVRNSF